MHVISHAKIDFLRFWLSIFFSVGRILDGLVGKMVFELTDHVCFVYRALFFLTDSAKNHVLNTVNQTAGFVNI